VQEETPLHFAAKHGHCDIVGELLAAGAALDAQDISVRCLLLGIAWKVIATTQCLVSESQAVLLLFWAACNGFHK